MGVLDGAIITEVGRDEAADPGPGFCVPDLLEPGLGVGAGVGVGVGVGVGLGEGCPFLLLGPYPGGQVPLSLAAFSFSGNPHVPYVPEVVM